LQYDIEFRFEFGESRVLLFQGFCFFPQLFVVVPQLFVVVPQVFVVAPQFGQTPVGADPVPQG
jgi:hypothetical protein